MQPFPHVKYQKIIFRSPQQLVMERSVHKMKMSDWNTATEAWYLAM